MTSRQRPGRARIKPKKGPAYDSLYVVEAHACHPNEIAALHDWSEEAAAMEQYAAVVLRSYGLPNSWRVVWARPIDKPPWYEWREKSRDPPDERDDWQKCVVTALAEAPSIPGYAAQVLRYVYLLREAHAAANIDRAIWAKGQLERVWHRIFMRKEGFEHTIVRERSRLAGQSKPRNDRSALHDAIRRYLLSGPGIGPKQLYDSLDDDLLLKRDGERMSFPTFRRDHWQRVKKDLGLSGMVRESN